MLLDKNSPPQKNDAETTTTEDSVKYMQEKFSDLIQKKIKPSNEAERDSCHELSDQEMAQSLLRVYQTNAIKTLENFPGSFFSDDTYDTEITKQISLLETLIKPLQQHNIQHNSLDPANPIDWLKTEDTLKQKAIPINTLLKQMLIKKEELTHMLLGQQALNEDKKSALTQAFQLRRNNPDLIKKITGRVVKQNKALLALIKKIQLVEQEIKLHPNPKKLAQQEKELTEKYESLQKKMEHLIATLMGEKTAENIENLLENEQLSYQRNWFSRNLCCCFFTKTATQKLLQETLHTFRKHAVSSC